MPVNILDCERWIAQQGQAEANRFNVGDWDIWFKGCGTGLERYQSRVADGVRQANWFPNLNQFATLGEFQNAYRELLRRLWFEHRHPWAVGADPIRPVWQPSPPEANPTAWVETYRDDFTGCALEPGHNSKCKVLRSTGEGYDNRYRIGTLAWSHDDPVNGTKKVNNEGSVPTYNGEDLLWNGPRPGLYLLGQIRPWAYKERNDAGEAWESTATATHGSISNYGYFAQDKGYFEIIADAVLSEALWHSLWFLSLAEGTGSYPSRHRWPPEWDLSELYASKEWAITHTMHNAPGNVSTPILRKADGSAQLNVERQYGVRPTDFPMKIGGLWTSAGLDWYVNGVMVRTTRPVSTDPAEYALQAQYNNAMLADLAGKALYMIADLCMGGSMVGSISPKTLPVVYHRIISMRAWRPATGPCRVYKNDTLVYSGE